MALKALMLRKQIEQKEKELEALREKSVELETREAELEKAIGEVETDEERSTVEAEVESFENEKSENDEATGKVEKELEDLKNELKDEEDKQVVEPTEEPKDDETREVKPVMETRENLTAMEAVVRHDEVKEFLSEVRTCVKEKRSIGNAGLTIPRVMLPMLELKAVQYSKLLSRVNLQQVGGTARQLIMGVIPEAVWTEMCANLNELDLAFNNVEMDGFKVGGFFAICNAILEDNDVQLASRIIDALAKSIGKALDKAIVYGTGVKMPLGIVTRLAQENQPASYPATYRPWVDLHTTHIIEGSGATGVGLFKEIVSNTKVLENDYFENGLVWVMNKKTHTDFKVNAMDKNMNAAIVSGMGDTMPVAGGDVVELPFMADGDYVVGYFDAYLLAQRAGTKLEQSEHVRFINDQTVFKGTARYDGTPVIPEAFLIGNIYDSVAPTLEVDFPEDTANFN